MGYRFDSPEAVRARLDAAGFTIGEVDTIVSALEMSAPFTFESAKAIHPSHVGIGHVLAERTLRVVPRAVPLSVRDTATEMANDASLPPAVAKLAALVAVLADGAIR